MKRKANPRGTLLFIALSVAFLVIVHFLSDQRATRFFEQELQPSPASSFRTVMEYPAVNIEPYVAKGLLEEDLYEVEKAYSSSAQDFASIAPAGSDDKDTSVEPVKAETPVEKVAKAEPPAPVIPAKKAPAYAPLVVKGQPKIAIIIDDMGVDRRRSYEVIGFDAPLTLAFLPYAEGLESITKDAQAAGHELMIHMPMQAMSDPVSLGPIALKSGMGESEVQANMEAAFKSFSGYVGLNNHMGSKVTQDRQIMDWAMESLKSRGLYFVDSKTIGSSVAADMARVNGLPTAERDVFLDHQETSTFVRDALRKVEETAARKGYAIAIGHPKTVTIEGLSAWLPDVQARGFEIVHASALVQRPRGGAKIASADMPIIIYPKPAASKVAAATPTQKAVVVPKATIVIQETEPASGEVFDPNGAQAREEILKKLLGQAN